MIYPMKLRAPLKDYLWGGTRLKTEYGKETSLAKVAESWELACHKEDQSIIENGADAVEFLLAGATAVSVGTANFRNPRASEEVAEGIAAYLSRTGTKDVRELIGAVR